MSVPISIPFTTFIRFPVLFISNTITGILFSRHIVNAARVHYFESSVNYLFKEIFSNFLASGSFSGSAV